MISIDDNKCEACGVCGHVCPRHIPESVTQNGRKVTIPSAERIDLCMECGHCQAVCPNDAVHVHKRAGEPVDGPEPLDDHRLLHLLKQRRSVRRYSEKPVPRELLDRILEAAHLAPTGAANRSTGVIVVDTPGILSKLSERFYKLYEDLEKQLKNPIARFIIKRRVGAPSLNTLAHFVMPGMHWYIKWYRDGRGNEILRDCPALMLFHSPILEPVAAPNCVIAAYQSILMGQSLGVGTCFNDLIPPACNRDPEVRRILDLQDRREVYAAVTLGYPKYRFRKTIPRRLAEVRYL